MTSTISALTTKLDKEISGIVRRSKMDGKFLPKSKKVSYADLLSNKMLMVFLIREGVPYSFFNLIQHLSPFTEENWAEFLDISTKSLQRYKQSDKKFKSSLTEKIIELAEVTHVGIDVFGEMSKFKLWLETPNFALGGLKPIELLKDSYGKEMVLGELTRINYGIFA